MNARTRMVASRLLDKLAAQGWVNTSPAPHDARSVLLSLSPAGERTAEQLDDARAERFAALFDAIPEDRRGDVLTALDALGIVVLDQGDRAREREQGARQGRALTP